MTSDEAQYLEAVAASEPVADADVYALAPVDPAEALERMRRQADTAYVRLMDGEMQPREALRVIAPYYRALEAEIKARETQLATVKRWLWDAYGQSGESVIALPDADMEITFRSPYPSVSWKRELVEGVITALTAAGSPLAVVLADAQQVKQVAGGPVIGRPRK